MPPPFCSPAARDRGERRTQLLLRDARQLYRCFTANYRDRRPPVPRRRSQQQQGPMRRLVLAAAAALCCLLLATHCADAEELPDSAAEAASSAPVTDPTPGGNATAGGGGGGSAAAASVCNPASLNSSKPVPCSEEQEQDAFQDLLIDTPSSSDPAAAVFDSSTCDPADAAGYTQPVDLFNAELLEVGGVPAE